MTPSARIAAAADVLDRVLAGVGAESALTNWGRASRYAGSGDRSAIRDLVFSALRCRRSFAALGGGLTGRGLMLGLAREAGQDVGVLFNGEGHALAPPGPQEAGRAPDPLEALDCPDWLAPDLKASLGSGFAPVMERLRHRAPVFLRVNAARIDVAGATAALAAEGIGAVPHRVAGFALEVMEGARKIQSCSTYAEGLVELQDASSQAVVEALPLTAGMRVLDLCAGGGGKTLAMAARAPVRVWAHDAHPRRMKDLLPRAIRAGARISISDNPENTAPYHLVLADVPCSGSGSWRRDPEGKWTLTPANLAKIEVLQAAILDRAAPMVAVGGVLAYATCSLLSAENEAQVTEFLARNRTWDCKLQRRFTPLDGGDGFFLAILTCKKNWPTQSEDVSSVFFSES